MHVVHVHTCTCTWLCELTVMVIVKLHNKMLYDYNRAREDITNSQFACGQLSSNGNSVYVHTVCLYGRFSRYMDIYTTLRAPRPAYEMTGHVFKI